MNSREIKHQIAMLCKGNLKKYFEKVAMLNKLIYNQKYLSDVEFIDKIENFIYKNCINNKKTTAT